MPHLTAITNKGTIYLRWVKQTLPSLSRWRVLGSVKQAAWASWIVSKRPLNSWTCRGQHNRKETKHEKTPRHQWQPFATGSPEQKHTHTNTQLIITWYTWYRHIQPTIKYNQMQLNPTLKKFRHKKWEIGSVELLGFRWWPDSETKSLIDGFCWRGL